MANEITLTASLSCTKSGASIASSNSKILSLTGDEALSTIMSVDYSADGAVPLSSLDTVGQLMIENLDSTNFVMLSTGTGGSFNSGKILKIRAGCCCLLEPNTATLYLKADTAACSVRITAVEV